MVSSDKKPHRNGKIELKLRSSEKYVSPVRRAIINIKVDISDLSCICNLSAATTLLIKTCTDICCGSNVFLVSHFSNPFV